MTVHQLRRWSDKVDSDMLRRWSDKAGSGLKASGKIAKDGFDAAYGKAMNHPRTAAAVVLGTGVAAALLWLIKRNSTYRAKRKETIERVRKPARARKARTAAATE
jgi:hypothetical protein